MYKLLIVEDEKVIREGIVSIIDWQDHDIEICAEAAHGEEALALLSELKPDIVITDIQMPKMSGLEFIEKARQTGEDFEAIVLTGYEDFNYAKQSIQLKVCDYILKPAKPDKILESVLRAKQKLEQAKMMNKQIHLLEQYTDKNMYLEKMNNLSNWFHQPTLTSVEDRIKFIQQLQMQIDPNNIHVGVVQLPTLANNFYFEDYELFKFATINITTETLAPFYQNHLEVVYEQNRLLWVANINPSTYQKEELKGYLEKLVENFSFYLKLKIHIGIGTYKESIKDMHISFNEAKQAMDESYYHKEINALFYSKLSDHSKKQILKDEKLSNLENDIVTNVFNQKYDAALDKLEKWLSYLESTAAYHKDQINLKAITLIIELQKFVDGKTLTKIEWENDLINWIDQLPAMNTFDDMSSIIKKIFQNVFEILTSERTIHRTVRIAQGIIEDRYDENLTLDSIASEVYVSSAYLSSLFKQELGINFLDYLHQYRISKAKKLLSEDLKIYEVANKTGYKDERHFSTTFKKWTGLTPTQFQKRARLERSE